MKPACPKCGHDDSRVLDSRANTAHGEVRRRRVCKQCDGRFTTFETVRADDAEVLEDRSLHKLLLAIEDYVAAKLAAGGE